MNGSHISEEELSSSSPRSAQEKGSKGSRKKTRRSTSIKKQKKKSVSTKDTNNFIKDINNILSDNDEALQKPRSTRMTMTINKKFGSAGWTSDGSSKQNRGTLRQSIAYRKTNTMPAMEHEKDTDKSWMRGKGHKSDPISLQETSINNESISMEASEEFEDVPSPQALALRDKLRQERLAKSREDDPNSHLSARRATARERLKSTVQSIKSRPTQANKLDPSKTGSKRDPVARVPGSTVEGNVDSQKNDESVAKNSKSRNTRISIRNPKGEQIDNRLNASDIYGSSSSDRESDYFDESSSYETDDSNSFSFDFDSSGVSDHSSSKKSTISAVDPKFEESRNDPLIYDMLMLGSGGVGKSALLQKFIKDSFSSAYHSTRGINQHSSTIYMGKRKMLDRAKLKKRHVHVKLNIWDIGGKLTKYSYIKNSYILNAIIVIVVYDITSLQSYLDALETIKHVRRIQHDQMIVLVGNKADNATVAADDDFYDSDEDEDNIVAVAPPPTGLRRLSMIGSRRQSAIASSRQQVQPIGEGGERVIVREIAKKEAALEALKLGVLFFETSAKTGHNVYVLFNEISKILVHKRRKLLFKIEAGIKSRQRENDEHSSDYESDSSSSSNESKEEAGHEGLGGGSSDDSDEESVLSAMSEWSDDSDDSDDDYVDIYGLSGGKKKEKADCVIM